MTNEPIVDVDLGPHNGVLKFFSVEEIQAFIQSEQQYWSWLQSSPATSQISPPGNVISQHFSSLNKQIRRANSTLIVGDRGILVNAFTNAFRNSRIPLSTSPVGKFIDELKSDSQIVAAAALASWLNSGGIDVSKFEHNKGMMLMAAFDAGITAKTPLAVKRSLEAHQKELQDAKDKTEKETADQREAFRQEKSQQRKTLARMIRQSRMRITRFREIKSARFDQVLSNFGELSAESIASIRQVENLYREHMRLKGPVEYWSNKADAHRVKTKIYRNVLIGFSVLSSFVLIGSLYWIAGHAIEIASTDKPPAVYLVLVTLGVVLTTIVFWAARILTRLFLSEHHLAIDAEERSIMAQTYLALTAEGQATEQERSIVLGSLFRPTADGIVKDDAAPDLSPASLLSRLGAR